MFDLNIVKADAKFLASLSQVSFSTMDLMNISGILNIMKQHLDEALDHHEEFKDTDPEWVEIFHTAMAIDFYIEVIGVTHAENQAVLKDCEHPTYEELAEEYADSFYDYTGIQVEDDLPF